MQNIPTDNLHADVSYKDGVANYHLKGDSLGGHFTLDGKIPFARGEEAAPGGGRTERRRTRPEASGRFRFERIQLSRLWDALGLGAEPRTDPRPGDDRPAVPTGRAGPDADRKRDAGRPQSAHRRHAADGKPDRRPGDAGSDRADPQPERDPGGGRFRGTVVYNYRNPDRSYFNLQLEQVDARVLLAAYPDVAAQVEGPVDLRSARQPGQRMARHRRSGADARPGVRRRGAGVAPAVELHVLAGPGSRPAGDPRQQRPAGATGGRPARPRSPGRRRWPPRLEGNARFYNAELRSLLPRNGELSSYAVGQVTGRVDFSADSLRSADDLNATVDAL